MQGKYRDAGSTVEIDSILAGGVTKNCLIWQNIEGERVIYIIKHITKSEDGKLVTFQIADFQNDFIQDEAVYVKLNYRGTMFRSSITKISKNLITLNFPLVVDVKTIELRGEPRISFDLSDEYFVSLGVIHDGKWQKEQVLRFPVVDISESGVCLLVSDQNKNFLKNSLVLIITHLGGVELDKPVSLEQKYSTPFRYRKNGKSFFNIRVGFSLSEKLPQDKISAFMDEAISKDI